MHMCVYRLVASAYINSISTLVGVVMIAYTCRLHVKQSNGSFIKNNPVSIKIKNETSPTYNTVRVKTEGKCEIEENKTVIVLVIALLNCRSKTCLLNKLMDSLRYTSNSFKTDSQFFPFFFFVIVVVSFAVGKTTIVNFVVIVIKTVV